MAGRINDRGTVLIGWQYYNQVRYQGSWEQVGIPDRPDVDIGFSFLSNTDILLGTAHVPEECSGYTPVCTPAYTGLYGTDLAAGDTADEPGFAVGYVMNDYGQSVVKTGDGGLGLAGGWRPSFDLADVADLSAWQELRVTAINNLGQFVGEGKTLAGDWHAFLATPEISAAQIDVQPEDEQNLVEPLIDGVVRVAVLSTSIEAGDSADFDATRIDPQKIRLGDWSARIAVPRSVEDVDNDSDMDVVFGFRAVKTGISCDDTDVFLYGETYDNAVFTATDSLTTDCGAGCHP